VQWTGRASRIKNTLGNWTNIGYRDSFLGCRVISYTKLTDRCVRYIQREKNEAAVAHHDLLEDRSYPLRNTFDDDDEDIDEGGEWTLGRRRPRRSRSAGRRRSTERRRQRKRCRQKKGGKCVDGDDDGVGRRRRGLRVLDKIVGMISQLPVIQSSMNNDCLCC